MKREYCGRSSVYTGRPATAWLEMLEIFINNADVLLLLFLSPSPFILIYNIIFLLNKLSERNDEIDKHFNYRILTMLSNKWRWLYGFGPAGLFPLVPPTPACWRTHCILFISPQRFSVLLSVKYSCLVLLLFAFYLHICFGKVRFE